MAAGGQRRRRGFLGQARADREAAGQRLGGGQHVGLDPGPFVGEQLRRPADAALHLVEYQQHPELVGDFAQPL